MSCHTSEIDGDAIVLAGTVEKMLEIGFTGIDTAPTYNNEDKVGESKIFGAGTFTVIGKVPKRAVEPNEVRTDPFRVKQPQNQPGLVHTLGRQGVA